MRLNTKPPQCSHATLHQHLHHNVFHCIPHLTNPHLPHHPTSLTWVTSPSHISLTPPFHTPLPTTLPYSALQPSKARRPLLGRPWFPRLKVRRYHPPATWHPRRALAGSRRCWRTPAAVGTLPAGTGIGPCGGRTTLEVEKWRGGGGRKRDGVMIIFY